MLFMEQNRVFKIYLKSNIGSWNNGNNIEERFEYVRIK